MAHSPQLVGSDRGLHIVFLGDANVGQGTLLNLFRGEQSAQEIAAEEAAGGDTGNGEFKIPVHQSYILDQVVDSEPIRIRITNSDGLSTYDRLRKPILRTSHLMVLCFTVSDRNSLRNLETVWLPIIKSLNSLDRQSDSYYTKPYVVCGLNTEQRQRAPHCVTTDEGQAFADSIDAMGYLECSIWDPSWEKVKANVISTAKEAYTVRFQQKRMKRNLRADQDQKMFGAGNDIGTDDVDRYVDEAMTVEEDINPLQKEDVVKSLSVLGQTPCLRHAYLRCDVSKMKLTSVDILRNFPNLQYIDVSGNNLRSLEPLGELPFLLHLNASRNQLVRTQSFGPPRHLEVCDLSYNMISDLGDWRCHKLLRELNLRGNFIQHIGPGLRRNYQLRMLDLSENHIMKIENLEGLSLEALYLVQNQLPNLEGIQMCQGLMVLNVRGNSIFDMSPLKNMPQLRKLCITENKIKSIEQVTMLPSLITDLYLSPNPLAELPQYRLQVLRRLPKLRVLDDVATSAQEKVKADCAYGDHVALEEDMFHQYLPREEFHDRRLITQEGIEGKEVEMYGMVGAVAPDADDALTASEEISAGLDASGVLGVSN